MRLNPNAPALAAALAGALLLGGCNYAPPRPTTQTPGDYGYTIEHLRWSIEKRMDDHEIVGLSIALVDDQDLVWAQGFGLADRERQRPADADTRYRAGSLTKLLTASAAARLEALGTWDLDSPLADYLPGFEPVSRFPEPAPIRLRHLLTHHAGLPANRLQGMYADPSEDFTRLAVLSNRPYLTAPTGSVFAYSNLGYDLAGIALEKATGEPFRQHVRRHLLEPAGMHRSRLSTHPPAGPDAARAYARGKDGAQRAYPIRDVPAGGLNTSVRDLAHFMRMLFAEGRHAGSSVLPAGAIDAMWREQNSGVALDMDLRVGLGWLQTRLPGAGRVVHHGGATQYHRAYLAVMPDAKLGVALLANTDSAMEALPELGLEALKLMWEARRGERLPEQAPSDPLPEGLVTDLDAFTGYFDTAYGFARVQRRDDELAVELNGERIDLVALGNGRFTVRGRLLGVIPVDMEEISLARTRLDDRELLLARLDQDGRILAIGERLEPVPIPAAWRDRLGEYRLINPEGLLADWSRGGRIRTLEQDGYLLVEVSGEEGIEQIMALRPLSETQALVRGLGSGKGDLVQVIAGDHGELIRYQGLLLQRTGGE